MRGRVAVSAANGQAASVFSRAGATLGGSEPARSFEELFWRGVYLRVFRDSRILGVGWPSIWFGLWHLAPASLSRDDCAATLVIGAVVLGFYLAFVARKTNAVWWAIVAHTLLGSGVIW